MATRASHVSILLLGIILLTKFSALVKAEFPKEVVKLENVKVNSEEKNNDNDRADHALETRGFLDELVSNVHGTITSSGNTFNNFGNNDSDGDQDFSGAVINAGPGGTLNSFNNDGGKQNFKGAVFNTGPGSGDRGAGFNKVNTFSGLTFFGNDNMPSVITSTGKTVDVNFDGLTLRGFNASKRGVTIRNNQIFVGDQLVCENIKEACEELTYQKSADGSLWYTNVKIGKPMNKAEIDKFEANWAQHKKEQEERAAERERRHNERMNALNQRLKQQAEKRERRQKVRQDALNARLKRQEEERERRAKKASMGRSSSFW